MNILILLMTGLGLVAGLALGAALYAWWLKNKPPVSIRLPHTWPLAPRVILTNQEHEVLVWLRATFHDHLVMIKLPVLRFTTPTDKETGNGSEKWIELLNGVYSTFTITTSDGNVVGCVDVPNKRGLSKASRGLKESLLSDCRIPYTVVRALALPTAAAMRAAFLGEVEVKVEVEQDQVEAQHTQVGNSSFHADLDSFTRQSKVATKEAGIRELNKFNDAAPKAQPAGFNPDGTGAAGSGASSRKPNRFPPQFEDSFTFTDESRPAKLNEF